MVLKRKLLTVMSSNVSTASNTLYSDNNDSDNVLRTRVDENEFVVTAEKKEHKGPQ